MTTGRNEPCPCGSGRKYKRCHGAVRSLASRIVTGEPSVAALMQETHKQHNAGNLPEAERLCRRAIEREPGNAQALNYLGLLLHAQGRSREAAEALHQAVIVRPDFAQAHSNLGSVLKVLGRLDEAEAAIRRALAIDPKFANAYNNLGSLLMRTRRDDALDILERAIAINPGLVEAHFNRASLLKMQGLIHESILAWRHTLELAPQFAEAHSNLLLTTHYSDELSAEAIFAEHRKYDALHARKPEAGGQRYGNTPDPARQLRIGYVSPDLRRHSVAYFIESVLAHHDRSAFEVTCFHNSPQEDEVSVRLRQHSASWINCAQMSDAELARTIAGAGIDVLVDLAGHTGGRMQTFARKPAPVQATWLGYPASTGLSAIDYRITDARADPPGHEARHSEKLARLPCSYFCYRPADESPEPGAPPSLERGFITFGSFNNIAKATPASIGLWARVLLAVPGARLLIKDNGLGGRSLRERIVAQFGALGIDAGRLELRTWEQSTAAHLSVYAEVDIALDTWPYNGATTTCEALWMGVPVVTLAGDRSESRMGASILTAAGCEDWVAESADEYVAIAARLAAVPTTLRLARAEMREKLRNSALLDAKRFTRDLEAAYRWMWQEWCVQRAN